MQAVQRLRQLLKLVMVTPLYHSGALSILRRKRTLDRAVILMYHRIAPGKEARFDYSPNGMVTTCRLFERHVRFLANNYRVVTIDGLCDLLEGDDPLSPDPVACITFDDGWRDNWENAVPLLEKYGLPATIFINCNFIDSIQWYWVERLKFVLAHAHKVLQTGEASGDHANTLRDQLRQLGAFHGDAGGQHLGLFLYSIEKRVHTLTDVHRDDYMAGVERVAALSRLDAATYFMNWEQIRSLADSGIEIGAHSMTHPDLTALSRETLYRELQTSREKLESKTGRPVKNLAYPYGKNNQTVREAASDSGFRSGCTTKYGLVDRGDELLQLNRINIHTDVAPTTSMFAHRLLAL